VDKFWKTEILPLRKTDSTVLIVSHGGIISVLRKHLMGLNYRFHESLVKETNDFWEVRNCSITEIVFGDKGPGEFTRMGDWQHILQYAISEYTKKQLENSTG
jgi:broad specificity phosphatase PhoE